MTSREPPSRTGLWLYGLIVAVVSSAALFVSYQGSRTLQGAVEEELSLQLSGVRRGTEMAVSTLVQDMESLAKQPSMLRILDRDVDFEIAGLLRAQLGLGSPLKRLVVFDGAGTLIASAGTFEATDIDLRLAFATLKAAGRSRRALITRHQTDLVVAVPIFWQFDQEEFLGALCAIVSPSVLLQTPSGWWSAVLDASGEVLEQRGAALPSRVVLDQRESVYGDLGRVVLRSASVRVPEGVTAPALAVAIAERYEVLFAQVAVLRRVVVSIMAGVAATLILLVTGFTRRRNRLMQRLADRAVALQNLTETMQLLLESTGEGIYGIDVAGRCTFINRAGAAVIGCRSEEILGKGMHALVHHTRADGSPYPADECPISQTCTRGTQSRVDGELFWRRDGTAFPVGYSSYPIIKDGAIRGAVVTFADVTEKQELESQLRQAQKLEAIGQLTGGVAHDFNNLLTVILGYAGFLEQSLEREDERRQDIGEIQKAAEHAAHLTQQLLAFSRRQLLSPGILDLNVLVSELVQMLRRVIGETIKLETRLACDLWKTKVDPVQIQQVLMNLAVNARDAMPHGGTLVIETANLDLGGEHVQSYPDASPGAYVLLDVSDTGVGMDAALQKRIFEPFFTTKPPGQGTGLGLSTVYGIVKQSGGSIRVDSEVGRGSSFKICLPAAPQAAAGMPSGAPRRPAGGKETILLVEDDAAIRSLGRRILQARGYDVLDAEAPAAAMVAASRAGAIDLLVTDVLMPGGTGPELYRQLVAERPGLKVVFMSGYSHDAAGLRELMAGHIFLQKPFTADSLARKIREALEQTA